MSIWATLWSTSADYHESDCAVWTTGAPDPDEQPIPMGLLTAAGIHHQDPTIACTRGCGPIAYTASHLWPDPADRTGDVDIAAIPTELTPDGTDTGQLDTYHPYLRLSVATPTDDATTILDLDQVQNLWETLRHWLNQQPPEETTIDALTAEIKRLKGQLATAAAALRADGRMHKESLARIADLSDRERGGRERYEVLFSQYEAYRNSHQAQETTIDALTKTNMNLAAENARLPIKAHEARRTGRTRMMMLRLRAWLIRHLGVQECGAFGGIWHNHTTETNAQRVQRWCRKSYGHTDSCAYDVLPDVPSSQPGFWMRAHYRGWDHPDDTN